MTFHLTKKERPLNYCPLPPRQICICPDALSDWDMLENNLDNNRVLRITLSSPRQWNLIWLYSEASHNTSYFRQLSYHWNQVSMRMWSMFDLSTLIIPKILKLFFRNFPFDKSVHQPRKCEDILALTLVMRRVRSNRLPPYCLFGQALTSINK